MGRVLGVKIDMAFVQTLKLQSFRCYETAAMKNLTPGFVVLHGANGAGKTNILEAVSLLAPGRGLRLSKVMEIQCQHNPNPWAVAAEVETHHAPGLIKIGTGLDAAKGKRTVRINGETARSQAALAPYVSAVWLTPQMDRLFLDSASQRRKFLDRLIYAFDPGHAGRVTRYENVLSQRSKLLKEGGADPAWLTVLEAQMSETGIAIAAARVEFCNRLQQACAQSEDTVFPAAQLAVRGTLEELLAQASALEVEELFAHQLQQSRERDAITGGAASGPHRSDLYVRYAAKNMGADQCSTGEQKALLIGIILAHARLIAAEKGAPPLMLFDEVAAHLDENRRAALYDLLADMGGQVWLTGTDEDLFAPIRDVGQFFDIENSQIYLQKNNYLTV